MTSGVASTMSCSVTRKRGLTRAAENVDAAGALDHFGHPVAADVERLQPFEKRDARAIGNVSDQVLDAAELLTDFFEQGFGGMAAARFFADPQDVAPDVAEVQRIEAKNLRRVQRTA